MAAKLLRWKTNEKLDVAETQHRRDVEEIAEIWRRKPLLRRVYHDFYMLIKQWLSDNDGETVEIGAGIGGLKTILPNCISTDMFPSPWTDQSENVYRLSFANESLANVVMLDVFHHLQFPGDALAECLRVLVHGGRVLIFEPDIGAMGLLVYGLLHHEPLGLLQQIQWRRDQSQQESSGMYYAAQANAHRIFLRRSGKEHLMDWDVKSITRLAALSYVAAGGFRKRQLYPESGYPAMKVIDELLSRLPTLFSTRMLVVLQKKERTR